MFVKQVNYNATGILLPRTGLIYFEAKCLAKFIGSQRKYFYDWLRIKSFN